MSDPMVKQVDDYLFRGPKVTQQVLFRLKELKISTVVNLQLGIPELFTGQINDELIWLTNHGIGLLDLNLWGFLHPPIRETRFALRKILQERDGGRRVYVHCRHGQERTGFVVAAYRMATGWTMEQAYQEMVDMGCSWPFHRLWKPALKSFLFTNTRAV